MAGSPSPVRPPWERVTTRYVADDNARLAALRTGEADLIDTVPPGEVARLSADPQLAVFGGDGSRTIFLNPDSVRERVPHVWDRHGLPLERNPLRDRRVREALSLAIDREGRSYRPARPTARPTCRRCPSTRSGPGACWPRPVTRRASA